MPEGVRGRGGAGDEGVGEEAGGGGEGRVVEVRGECGEQDVAS